MATLVVHWLLIAHVAYIVVQGLWPIVWLSFLVHWLLGYSCGFHITALAALVVPWLLTFLVFVSCKLSYCLFLAVEVAVSNFTVV